MAVLSFWIDDDEPEACGAVKGCPRAEMRLAVSLRSQLWHLNDARYRTFSLSLYNNIAQKGSSGEFVSSGGIRRASRAVQVDGFGWGPWGGGRRRVGTPRWTLLRRFERRHSYRVLRKESCEGEACRFVSPNKVATVRLNERSVFADTPTTKAGASGPTSVT